MTERRRQGTLTRSSGNGGSMGMFAFVWRKRQILDELRALRLDNSHLLEENHELQQRLQSENGQLQFELHNLQSEKTRVEQEKKALEDTKTQMMSNISGLIRQNNTLHRESTESMAKIQEIQKEKVLLETYALQMEEAIAHLSQDKDRLEKEMQRLQDQVEDYRAASGGQKEELVIRLMEDKEALEKENAQLAETLECHMKVSINRRLEEINTRLQQEKELLVKENVRLGKKLQDATKMTKTTKESEDPLAIQLEGLVSRLNEEKDRLQSENRHLAESFEEQQQNVVQINMQMEESIARLSEEKDHFEHECRRLNTQLEREREEHMNSQKRMDDVIAEINLERNRLRNETLQLNETIKKLEENINTSVQEVSVEKQKAVMQYQILKEKLETQQEHLASEDVGSAPKSEFQETSKNHSAGDDELVTRITDLEGQIAKLTQAKQEIDQTLKQTMEKLDEETKRGEQLKSSLESEIELLRKEKMQSETEKAEIAAMLKNQPDVVAESKIKMEENMGKLLTERDELQQEKVNLLQQIEESRLTMSTLTEDAEKTIAKLTVENQALRENVSKISDDKLLKSDVQIENHAVKSEDVRLTEDNEHLAQEVKRLTSLQEVNSQTLEENKSLKEEIEELKIKLSLLQGTPEETQSLLMREDSVVAERDLLEEKVSDLIRKLSEQEKFSADVCDQLEDSLLNVTEEKDRIERENEELKRKYKDGEPSDVNTTQLQGEVDILTSESEREQWMQTLSDVQKQNAIANELCKALESEKAELILKLEEAKSTNIIDESRPHISTSQCQDIAQLNSSKDSLEREKVEMLSRLNELKELENRIKEMEKVPEDVYLVDENIELRRSVMELKNRLQNDEESFINLIAEKEVELAIVKAMRVLEKDTHVDTKTMDTKALTAELEKTKKEIAAQIAISEEFQYRIEELQKELDQVKLENQELQNQYLIAEEYQSHIDALQREIDNVKAENEEVRSQCTQLEECRSHIQALELEIKTLKDSKVGNSDQHTNQEGSVNVKDLQEQIKMLKSENEKLKPKNVPLEEYISQNEQLHMELANFKSENEILLTKCKEADCTAIRLTDVENDLIKTREEAEKYKQQAEKAESTLQTAMDNTDKLQSEITGLQHLYQWCLSNHESHRTETDIVPTQVQQAQRTPGEVLQANVPEQTLPVGSDIIPQTATHTEGVSVSSQTAASNIGEDISSSSTSTESEGSVIVLDALADENKALRHRIQGLELDLESTTRDLLTFRNKSDKYKAMSCKVQVLESDLELAHREIAALKHTAVDVGNIPQQIFNMEEEVSAAREQLTKYKLCCDEHDQLTRKLVSELNTVKAEHESETGKLHEMIQTLNNDKIRMAQQLQGTDSELGTILRSAEQVEIQMRELETILEKVKLENQYLKGEVERLGAPGASDLESVDQFKMLQMETNSENMMQQITSLKNELENCQQDLHQQKREAEKHKLNQSRLETQIASLKVENIALSNELDSVQNKKQEKQVRFTESNDQMLSQISRLQNELEETRKQVNDLKTVHEKERRELKEKLYSMANEMAEEINEMQKEFNDDIQKKDEEKYQLENRIKELELQCEQQKEAEEHLFAMTEKVEELSNKLGSQRRELIDTCNVSLETKQKADKVIGQLTAEIERLASEFERNNREFDEYKNSCEVERKKMKEKLADMANDMTTEITSMQDEFDEVLKNKNHERDELKSEIRRLKFLLEEKKALERPCSLPLDTTTTEVQLQSSESKINHEEKTAKLVRQTTQEEKNAKLVRQSGEDYGSTEESELNKTTEQFEANITELTLSHNKERKELQSKICELEENIRDLKKKNEYLDKGRRGSHRMDSTDAALQVASAKAEEVRGLQEELASVHQKQDELLTKEYELKRWENEIREHQDERTKEKKELETQLLDLTSEVTILRKQLETHKQVLQAEDKADTKRSWGDLVEEAEKEMVLGHEIKSDHELALQDVFIPHHTESVLAANPALTPITEEPPTVTQKLQDENQRLTNALKDKDEEQQKLEADKKSMEIMLHILQEEKMKLETTVNDMSSEMVAFKEQLLSMNELQQTNEHLREQLQNSVREQVATEDRRREEVNQLELQLQSTSHEIDDLRVQLKAKEDLQEAYYQLSGELQERDSSTQEYQDLQQQVTAELQEENLKLKLKNQELKHELSVAGTAGSPLENKIQNLAGKQLLDENSYLAAEVQRFRELYTSEMEKSTEIETRMMELEEEVEASKIELEKEVTEYKQVIVSLQDAVKGLKEEKRLVEERVHLLETQRDLVTRHQLTSAKEQELMSRISVLSAEADVIKQELKVKETTHTKELDEVKGEIDKTKAHFENTIEALSNENRALNERLKQLKGKGAIPKTTGATEKGLGGATAKPGELAELKHRLQMVKTQKEDAEMKLKEQKEIAKEQKRKAVDEVRKERSKEVERLRKDVQEKEFTISNMATQLEHAQRWKEDERRLIDQKYRDQYNADLERLKTELEHTFAFEMEQKTEHVNRVESSLKSRIQELETELLAHRSSKGYMTEKRTTKHGAIKTQQSKPGSAKKSSTGADKDKSAQGSVKDVSKIPVFKKDTAKEMELSLQPQHFGDYEEKPAVQQMQEKTGSGSGSESSGSGHGKLDAGVAEDQDESPWEEPAQAKKKRRRKKNGKKGE